jgi:ABC-type nitrate/sulfonate/bicarbonate transport system substrate-binding protein
MGRSWWDHGGRSRLLLAGALSAIGLAPGAARADGPPAKVRVAIEREADLRLLPLWVGIGNGDFRRAGIEVQPVVLGPKAGAALTGGEVKLAALRPALWGPLVTAKAEVAIVAALLRDDDANLILARRVEPTRGTTASGPVASRLDALRELRVGYVDVSARRLTALLGPRAPRVQLVALEPDAADRAFTAGDVDALYAPSPWAERALVPGEGVLWIHASRGEGDAGAAQGASPILSALVVSRAYAASDEAQLMAIVRGLAAAEQLVHDERAAAVHALVEALPTVDRGLLEAATLLYEPAVPRDPRVDVEGVTATLRAREPTLDVSTLELGRSVDARFGERAASATPKPRRFMKIAGAVLGVVIGGIVTFMVLYRKKTDEKAGDDA